MLKYLPLTPSRCLLLTFRSYGMDRSIALEPLRAKAMKSQRLSFTFAGSRVSISSFGVFIYERTHKNAVDNQRYNLFR